MKHTKTTCRAHHLILAGLTGLECANCGAHKIDTSEMGGKTKFDALLNNAKLRKAEAKFWDEYDRKEAETEKKEFDGMMHESVRSLRKSSLAKSTPRVRMTALKFTAEEEKEVDTIAQEAVRSLRKIR